MRRRASKLPSLSEPDGGTRVQPLEAVVWAAVGQGWRPLFGRFIDLGLSFEWHDFESDRAMDWSRSFHPGSLEVCLNLEGQGTVCWGGEEAAFAPRTAGFYCQGHNAGLRAERRGGMRHRFITVEISHRFLASHLASHAPALHPLARGAVEADGTVDGVGPVEPLTAAQAELVRSFRLPPVSAAAQRLWYESKALELMAQVLFRPEVGGFFCTRQHHLARERVDRVIAILNEDLSEPPTLEDLGRRVGCSPFHLSRTFSSETGMTIPQYMRQRRMERAAELLRSGRCNVTEAALEVGYSSLSHFSAAFHETFGCCPGLYPLETPPQRDRRQALPG
ncbi:MAG: AraC family transcriptional regulator [Verrucomicrobia bacterium]|nr:AraC family transcriptional regulator [Verrucomicrobiota bacterium]